LLIGIDAQRQFRQQFMCQKAISWMNPAETSVPENPFQLYEYSKRTFRPPDGTVAVGLSDKNVNSTNLSKQRLYV
jgi:hypothetical protein